MAFEPGGMSDKLGNRYEGRWVAKQLLRLLNEEIKSVTVELIGPEEQGVDLLIVKNDDVRQLQQCKARNASNESWSVSTLAARGILENLRTHLSRDPYLEFAFISSIPAQNLADICESARHSNGSPKDFYKYQIEKLGQPRRATFSKFCCRMKLDSCSDNGKEYAYDYLKRLHFVTFSDDENSWNDLLTWSGFILSAEPKTAVSVLLTYAENMYQYRKPIYANDLINYLAQHHNIHPKNLSQDERTEPAIHKLQQRFSESIQPGLINKHVIGRKETKKVIECIESRQDVVLHGAAGFGKSSILFELTEYLNNAEIPFLPIRLDRRIPEKTARQFGKDIGLQDSPENSLVGYAAGRKCVLILDQLDAIRWTGTHSSEAMDVCKEIILQIQSLRRSNKNVVVVVACRTFDLENDPEIRSLFTNKQKQGFEKIAVAELSNDMLLTILGKDFDHLSSSQKNILACPSNLAIWMELKNDEDSWGFYSATDLMRRFWGNRRRVLNEKVKISGNALDIFLHPILDYVERTGEISIPSSLSDGYPIICDAMISYGILQRSSGRISFCHQRYLDYLIAERLLRQIHEGNGNILEWLGSKEKQSLLRREQLRQVLTILTEESLSEFLTQAKKVLESTEVRFHLKHLVLEVLGSLKEINHNIGEYCLYLFSFSLWQEHILEIVFFGHPNWVRHLLAEKIISEWLSSQEATDVNRALWLLRSVAEQIPDQVTEALTPYLENEGEWPNQILGTICWQLINDSEKMFEMRLQLARRGFFKDYVDWKPFCAKYPLRAIRLLEAVISTWQIEDEETHRRPKGRLEEWVDEDKRALNSAVQQYPAETWDLLAHHIERLTSIENAEEYDSRLSKWSEPIRIRGRAGIEIARGIVDLLILAGQTMAGQQPDELIKRIRPLEKSLSPIISEIIISVYAHLPEYHADIAIEWLLGDSKRFRLGAGYNEPKWMPAVRLIGSLSQHCSDKLFRQLEETIIHYHEPEEKRKAEYYLKGWRKGYFDHYWGETQHFLLPALDQRRLKHDTLYLIQVLRRKFETYNTKRFLRGGETSGGWVGSKLERNLDKISDGAWLRIINCKKVSPSDNHKWIPVDPDNVVTTSVRQFAGSLGRISKRFPERFGQLALHFPDDVDPRYVSAIIDSFSRKQPDENVPEEEKCLWQPAQADTIEAVLAKYKSGDDREIAMSFCRLVEARSDQQWSNQVIARLVHYARNHPDLPVGILNLHCDKNSDEVTINTLYQNTLNCVRGCAARAIGKLLWEPNSILEQVRPAIESLVKDPHPVVRMAVIEALVPVLNINRDMAVEWFCTACMEDLRVAASPRAMRFLGYIIPSHIEQVDPIIRQMVASPLDEVALEGACQVTAMWLFYGFFYDELTKCLKGSVHQRKGVATVAAQLLFNEKCSKKSIGLLYHFMNDPDKDVREALHNMFGRNEFNLITDDYSSLIKYYIKSQAFLDSPDNFINLLKSYTGKLIPISETVFEVCNELATTLKDKSSDIGLRYPHNTNEMISILLRLYDHALGDDNKTIVNRCLDIWDIFFENRVGRAIELTRAIDR